MPVDQAIMEKIKKLLSLGGNNPNKNEAEFALKKAAELAERHGLSVSDIDPETKEVKVNTDRIIVRKAYVSWMITLIDGICRSFDCSAVWSDHYMEEERGAKLVTIIGMKTDVEIACWYVKNIRLRIQRNAEEYNLQNDRVTFCYGAAVEVRQRLIDMYIKPKQEAQSQATRDLVVVKKDEVAKAVHEMFPHLRKMRTIKTRLDNPEALNKGREYGRTMPITKQVN